MKAKHLFVLIAMCGLAAATIGVTVNTAGVFYAPIAEDLAVGRGSVAMIITICSIVGAIVALFVPKILKEQTLKIIIITATVLLCGSTYMLSRCTSLGQMYILSVVRGAGNGLINFVMITMMVNYWFFARRGLFTSIVMAFSGVPGVLLSPVFSNIINASGWRAGFVWVAIATLICCLPAVVLPFTVQPKTCGLEPFGYAEFLKEREMGRTVVIDDRPKQFNFFNPKFLLAILVTVAISVIAAVPQHFPGYAVSLGKAASIGAMMLSASMAFNILSKLAFGVMNDRYGAYKSILVMSAVNITGILLLLFVPQEWALLAGAGLYAVAFAVGAVGIAMLSGYLFGMEYYATAYPILSFVGGVANAVGATLVGSLYDATGTYTVNFWLALACQAVLILSLVGAVAIRRNERHSGLEEN
ncbi:MAG: MFS transporter [Erysipelotrichaceae bacterium]|nr:MFS transporter [Erysipelotrichaceae bacterium]